MSWDFSGSACMRQFLIMNLFLYVYILLGLFIWITLTNTSLDVPHSTMSNIFHVIYLKALTTCATENLHVIYSWPSISSDSVNCRSYTTVVHNIKKKNLSISGPAQFKLALFTGQLYSWALESVWLWIVCGSYIYW